MCLNDWKMGGHTNSHFLLGNETAQGEYMVVSRTNSDNWSDWSDFGLLSVMNHDQEQL